MKNEKFSTKVLAEIAIFAALGFALDIIQGGIWRGVFINGGSIGFGMLPIFVISYRRGLLPGILCGLILSIVQMLGGIYPINGASFENQFMQIMGPFFQIMLDYILAYTVVGAAGVFSKQFSKGKSMGSKILWVSIGCIVGGLLKYACHVLAGGLFWLDSGNSFWGIIGDTWLYSFVYNGAYCIPNIVICLIVMILIVKFYGQFLEPNTLQIQKEEKEYEQNPEK